MAVVSNDHTGACKRIGEGQLGEWRVEVAPYRGLKVWRWEMIEQYLLSRELG